LVAVEKNPFSILHIEDPTQRVIQLAKQKDQK
jgi:hypothetical protein